MRRAGARRPAPRRAHPLVRRGRVRRPPRGRRGRSWPLRGRGHPLLREVVRHRDGRRAHPPHRRTRHGRPLPPEWHRQRGHDRRDPGPRSRDGWRRPGVRGHRPARRHRPPLRRPDHLRRARRAADAASGVVGPGLRPRRYRRRALDGHPARTLGEVRVDLCGGRHDRTHALPDRRDPRYARMLADVQGDRRGDRCPGRRGEGRARARHRGPDHAASDRHRAGQLLVALPGPQPRQAARARGPPRPRGAPGRAARRRHAGRRRGLRGAQASRRGEGRLTSPVRAVWRSVARYRARYIAGVACLGLATLASLAIPWRLKRATGALQHDAANAPLAQYVRLIIVFALANGVARLGSRFAIVGGGQRIEYDVRNDLSASFLGFPPRFYAAHPTGDLMTRASSDVSAVKALVGFGAVSLAATAFAFAGALLAMLAVDPWLTLWALAPYPAMIVLSKRFNAVVHARSQAAQDQLGVLSAKVQEYLAGMTVVRAYTLEGRAAREFGRENDEYLRRSLALVRSQSSFAPLMGLIAGVGTLIVLWAGGKAVVEGRLTLGALAAFNGYLAYLTWPTIALGWTLSIVRRGLTSMQRINEITRTDSDERDEKIGFETTEPLSTSIRPPAVEVDLAAPAPIVAGTARPARTVGGLLEERPGSVEPSPIFSSPASSHAPAIRFENLTFAYAGRPPALRGVSFAVGAGETVAVVGPTGSGKSTLGLLLARLWEPAPGTVFVGERDVTRLPRGALRVMLGYMPQEGFLFSRSIAENITLGREDADAARVPEAAVAAGGRRCGGAGRAGGRGGRRRLLRAPRGGPAAGGGVGACLTWVTISTIGWVVPPPGDSGPASGMRRDLTGRSSPPLSCFSRSSR